MKKLIIVLLVSTAIFLVLNTNILHAQCPMCKANVESSLKNTERLVGKGLNTGILYLLALPYLLAGAGCLYYYRKYRTGQNQ
jgi:hypothetical protein